LKKEKKRPTVPNFFGDVSGIKEHFILPLTGPDEPDTK